MPTDDLIERTARAIIDTIVRRNAGIAGRPYHPDDWDEFDLHVAGEHARAAIAIIAPAVLDMAAEVCRDEQTGFLSPEYATQQPMSSVGERFACAKCIEAILALKAQFEGDKV